MRRILATITSVALGMGFTVALALGASPAYASCQRDIKFSHSPNYTEIHVITACAHLWRASADFGGHWTWGPYTGKGGYSIACDISSCQGHPDGTLFKGGYDRKTPYQFFCKLGC